MDKIMESSEGTSPPQGSPMDLDSPESPSGSSGSELSYHSSRSVTPEVLKNLMEFSDDFISFSPTISVDSPSTSDSDFIKTELVEHQRTSTMMLRSSIRYLVLDDDVRDEHHGLKTLAAAASFVESDGISLGEPLQRAAIQNGQISLNTNTNQTLVEVNGSTKEKDAAEALLTLSRSGSETATIKQEVVDTPPSNESWRLRFRARYVAQNKVPRAVVHPNPGFEKINQEIERSTVRFSPESCKFEAPKPCKQCINAKFTCTRMFPCKDCLRRGMTCESTVEYTPVKRLVNRLVKKEPSVKQVITKEASVKEITIKGPSTKAASTKKNSAKKSFIVKLPVKAEVFPVAAAVKPPSPAKKAKIAKPDPNLARPESYRPPEVWATSRYDLCETIPDYRAFQSGCYVNNGWLCGYLLDSVLSPNDFITGQVVMSHSGGKSDYDIKTGLRKLKANQLEDDSVVRAIINNLKCKVPFLMILGNRCPASQVYLKAQYSVMDWFIVTHVWQEPDTNTRYVRFKYRFEKLDLYKASWWVPKAHGDTRAMDLPPSANVPIPAEVELYNCEACGCSSPVVFDGGYFCKIGRCPEFFKFNGSSVETKDLVVSEAFCNARTPRNDYQTDPPHNIVDCSKHVIENIDSGLNTRLDCRGIICPQCSRCLARIYFDSWRCEGPQGCGMILYPKKFPIFTVAELSKAEKARYTGSAQPSNLNPWNIPEEVCFLDVNALFQTDDSIAIRPKLRMHVYDLGRVVGKVYHIFANESFRSEAFGPDYLLEAYQNPTSSFKRNKIHTVSGEGLTAHMAWDAGQKYNYFVKNETLPLDQNPAYVSQALNLVSRMVTHTLGKDPKFNEILSVCYYDGMKMSFHDDGEPALGPTVASLSLGSPGVFTLRVKQCHLHDPTVMQYIPKWRGNNKPSAIQTDDLDADVDVEDHAEQGDDEDEPECQDESSSPKKKKKDKAPSLTLNLSHGDIVVMDGHNVQTYWEHQALVSGPFRIAATARNIDPNITKGIHSKKPLFVNGKSIPRGFEHEQAYADLLASTPDPTPRKAAARSNMNGRKRKGAPTVLQILSEPMTQSATFAPTVPSVLAPTVIQPPVPVHKNEETVKHPGPFGQSTFMPASYRPTPSGPASFISSNYEQSYGSTAPEPSFIRSTSSVPSCIGHPRDPSAYEPEIQPYVYAPQAGQMHYYHPSGLMPQDNTMISPINFGPPATAYQSQARWNTLPPVSENFETNHYSTFPMATQMESQQHSSYSHSYAPAAYDSQHHQEAYFHGSPVANHNAAANEYAVARINQSRADNGSSVNESIKFDG